MLRVSISEVGTVFDRESLNTLATRDKSAKVWSNGVAEAANGYANAAID